MVTEIDTARRSAPSSSRERRGQVARRFKTFWPTSLRTANEIRRVHVLNISRTGAKIHAQEPMDVHQALELAIGEEWHGALVRWRCGQTFGIAFETAISEASLHGNLDAR